MSLNKWVGMGRITKDLELNHTQSGAPYMNFTIAVEDDYKPKDGSDKAVYFVDCTAWSGTAEFIQKWFGKGRNIAVIGALQSRKWEDKEGNKRTSWFIKVESAYFADSKRDGNSSGGSGSYQQSPDVSAEGFTEMPNDGDLPF